LAEVDLTMAEAKRNVITVADAAALAEAAAQRVLARIDANKGRIAICLTGGSSPKRLYELLGSDGCKNKLPWDRVHWFIGDDRFVPPADPLNNMAMARHIFLDRCAPSDHIHPMLTDGVSLVDAALLYEKELKTFYGADVLDPAQPLFDIVLMGVGPDGHTASLFPGSVAVDEVHLWVTGVEKANVEPFVPRISLTLPTLASCREMLFEVSGADKSGILARVLAGEDLPSARAHSQGETVWLCDAAARPDEVRG
jgi:6-phosphogluconolactonase